MSDLITIIKEKTKTMTDAIQHNTGLDERNIAATDLKAAEDKIQSLCVSHAATFVAVERRGATLTASLQNLLSVLDEAAPKVEEAKECLEIDGGSGNNSHGGEEKTKSEDEVVVAAAKKNTLANLAEKHRMRRRTLLQHSSLLELLEMPSLMDACVRGHLYEEGLSIASFANTLERKHLSATSSSTSSGQVENQHGNDATTPSTNPIVANVVKEVRKREIDLRRHLLHRLRSDVTMPQCLEVVTALRRLNGVELERSSRDNSTGANNVDLEKIHEAMEWRLQVNFLEARDVWLEGNTVSNSATLGLVSQSSRKLGKKILSNGNSEQLLDNIDVYRTRCFEIATQFLAIFRSSTSHKASTSNNSDKASQLLSMWTTRRIDTFLHQQLSMKYLPLISDTATLRDALESTTFFATSMGRIGSDFSPLLPAFFVPRLISIVTSSWSNGLNSLQDTLKVCRDAGIASPLYNSREVISPIGTNAEDEGDIGTGIGAKTPSPPRQLLSLPPLARLVNSFLTGLNELRRCLLASAFPQLRSFFRESFIVKVKAILVENERAVLKPGFLSKGEEAGKLRSVAIELKEEFEGCVEPYLSNALEVALGSFDNILAKPEISPDDSDSPVLEEEGLVNTESNDAGEEGKQADQEGDEKLSEIEDLTALSQENEVISEAEEREESTEAASEP